MSDLRLDFCDNKAARHAVMRWHYSRAMPAFKLVRLGVWESGRFVGAILYGVGANRHIARPFKLRDTEVCELVRVALAPGRRYPTSKCLAISLRMLKQQSPGLKLVVSYADAGQGPVGTIYQATNWIFLGAATQPYLKVKGKVVHPRTLYDRYGPGGQSLPWLRANVDPNAQRVKMAAKLKYVMPLEPRLREKLTGIARPYIKNQSVGSSDGAAPGDQPGEGGSSPTPTLQAESSALQSGATESG